MKMTNEEKAASYSLYYGTKTGMCGDNHYRKIGVSCDIWDIDYLELRSVEQLTETEQECVDLVNSLGFIKV